MAEDPLVCFACREGHDAFLRPLMHALRGQVRMFADEPVRPDDLAAAAQASDVVWLEWADALAAFATRRIPILSRRRVIVRLHSYELFSPLIEEIDWSVVDDLVFVGEHMKGLARSLVPSTAQVSRQHVLPNGVELDRFGLQPHGPGHKVAWIGSINHKKGVMLLVQAFAALLRRDRRYELHLAGAVQDPRFSLYLDHAAARLGIGDRIHRHGWIDDLPAWLADMDHVVSTSPLESQGMGLLEAAACGLRPAVHHFIGAESVVPEQWLWFTTDEFVERILQPVYEPAAYRGFVAERYEAGACAEAVAQLLVGLPRG